MLYLTEAISVSSEYEAELDFELLQRWCDYHNGKDVDEFEFQSILMGVFLGGQKPDVIDFLRRFSQFYDSTLFDNLIRICDETKLDDDVMPWIVADLNDKRPLFASDRDGQMLVELIDRGELRFAESYDEYYDVLSSSANHSAAYDIVNEYCLERVHKKQLRPLLEPLYHICNSYNLVFGILAKCWTQKLTLAITLKFTFAERTMYLTTNVC